MKAVVAFSCASFFLSLMFTCAATSSESEIEGLKKTMGMLQQQMEALQQKIVAMHPYELPEIVVVPIISGLPQYLSWISSHTNQNRAQ